MKLAFMQLPALVVDQLLVERVADAVRHAPLHLPRHDHGVDQLAAVVHHDVAQDLHHRRLRHRPPPPSRARRWPCCRGRARSTPWPPAPAPSPAPPRRAAGSRAPPARRSPIIRDVVAAHAHGAVGELHVVAERRPGRARRSRSPSCAPPAPPRGTRFPPPRRRGWRTSPSPSRTRACRPSPRARRSTSTSSTSATICANAV